MRQTIRLLLRLYPVDYRQVFGPEMMMVFETNAEAQRHRGTLAYLRFTASELFGFIAGAARERLMPRKTIEESACPITLAELDQRIQQNLRRMEHAIAHHDFPTARACSQIDLDLRRTRQSWSDRGGRQIAT